MSSSFGTTCFLGLASELQIHKGVSGKFEANFQSLDLGALGRGRPDAKLCDFREHIIGFSGENPSIWPFTFNRKNFHMG